MVRQNNFKESNNGNVSILLSFDLEPIKRSNYNLRVETAKPKSFPKSVSKLALNFQNISSAYIFYLTIFSKFNKGYNGVTGCRCL